MAGMLRPVIEREEKQQLQSACVCLKELILKKNKTKLIKGSTAQTDSAAEGGGGVGYLYSCRPLRISAQALVRCSYHRQPAKVMCSHYQAKVNTGHQH